MKEKLAPFLRFSVSSGLCFLLDYGLFTLLNAVLLRDMADGGRELIATYGARVISAVLNFLLNRNMVFHSAASPGRSAVRYTLLAVAQAAVSALLVYLIRRLTGSTQLMETVIKIPVDVGLFLASYQIQKRWVFAEDNKEE